MNNLKKNNYIQFNQFKKKISKNSLIAVLHLNYDVTNNLQMFFSTCKEKNINMLKLKLNFLQNRVNKKEFNTLLKGPSLILHMEPNAYKDFKKIIEQYSFCLVLTYIYKNKFLKPNVLESYNNKINSLSTKLSIPSNFILLYFFKRLNSLVIITFIKPLLYIFSLIRIKCLQ